MYKQILVNGGWVDTSEIDWENSKIEYDEGYGPDEKEWKAEEDLLKKYVRDQDKQGSTFRNFAGKLTADGLIERFNTTREAAVIRIEEAKEKANTDSFTLEAKNKYQLSLINKVKLKPNSLTEQEEAAFLKLDPRTLELQFPNYIIRHNSNKL